MRRNRSPHLFDWLAFAALSSESVKTWPRLGGAPRLRCSWLPENVHWLAFHRTDLAMMLLPLFLATGVGVMLFFSRAEGCNVWFLVWSAAVCQGIGHMVHPTAPRLRASTRVCRLAPDVATPAQRRAEWLQALTRQDVRTSFVGAPTWHSYWVWMAIRIGALLVTYFGLFDRDFAFKGDVALVLLLPGLAIFYQAYAFVARRVFLTRLKRAVATPLCPACGYDLTSFAMIEDFRALARCPECGTKHPLFVPPIPPPAFTYPVPTLVPPLHRGKSVPKGK